MFPKKKLNQNNFEDSIAYVQLKTICSRFNNLQEKFGKYLPTIMIYNIEINSDSLKEILNYQNVVSKNQEYDFEDNLAFIKKFSSSPQYLQSFNFYKNQSFKIYPSSMRELSRGFLIKKIDLISLSENEIIFSSNVHLKKDFSFMFEIEGHLKYFATIYKIKEEHDKNIFHGIINSLNENEKTKLRKNIIKG